MNTTNFRNLFPTVITNSIFNDSYLDGIFEKLNTLSDYSSLSEKYLIRVEENSWKIEIPLPGASKEDIKISLKEATNLSVEVVGETEWSKGERRDFKLPTSADPDSILAEMKNGLLVITISKKKSSQDKLVKIK